MSENVKNKVKELLASGKIAGFLGLSNQYGQIGPCLFKDDGDLDHLVMIPSVFWFEDVMSGV